ncbi:protein-glutamate O-methyltransferase [Agaricicola taiwanensis]|uniref:protein-glutamate O-methyltransferase n=1 Tax=Agaricicola taiwanensis TaxID=591372 RepID=A0A8J2VNY4_9RHOB|nr:CheR family methyltransferase [Agaricicola taiwanensis]GGE41585.1 protein-glutamate O-methyltransferase [Agaricicola taiwanensis]
MARDALTRPPRLAAPPGRDFTRLKSLIIQRTGHFYYQDKDDVLWERVSRRMRDKGVRSLPDYIQLLQDPSAPEWNALEAEITIGETYFFRYAEQFTALSQTILPSIIEQNRDEKRIRIWSAGCATGAEPYSVAILLWRLLGEELEDWRISIIGTDINDRFLAAARKAQFGHWALRAVSADERDQLFEPVATQTWQLKRRFRAMVQFERHNLMSLIDGASPLQFTDFDLVMCRNVLIYFDPAAILRLMEAFRDRIVEGGWLLIGHAEPNPAFSGILRAVTLPGTVAYRNLPPEAAAADPGFVAIPYPETPRPASQLPQAPIVLPPPRLPRPSPAVMTPSAPPTERQPVADVISEVQSLSDLGSLEASLKICIEALEDHPTEPRLYFYQGLIRRAQGDNTGAEQSLKKALFLERNYIMAHYHLGLIQLHNGNIRGGRRHLTNAARLSLALPAKTALLDGDGLEPETLVDLVRFHLEHHPPH